MIRKATSRKKDLTKSILLAVRDTCVDWYKGNEPEDDPAMRGKKDGENVFKIDRPPRFVGPSSTQVNFLSVLIVKKKGFIKMGCLALYGKDYA